MDEIDALSMTPGIAMVHWFAWNSDEFIYKISVLSWVWVCACSINYHLSGCSREMLRYDLRAQWVAQVFILLSTPQSAWPVLVCGLLPVRRKGRLLLNGLGAYWFLWHTGMGKILLTISYSFYIGQFMTGHRWMHSVFHLFLHAAGACAAVKPRRKFMVPLPGWTAYIVEVAGLFLLLPPLT